MNPKIEKRFANIAKSKTFKNIVKIFDLDKKSVFDIGCSYGEFLSFFGKGSVGLTIHHNEVAYGKSKGLDIRYGNIESETFVLDEKFDVIFANNLLEHLYSPHSFLCDIKKFLKPDGVLILGVPCVPKVVFLYHLKKFRGSLAGAHINFFTRNTLTISVERGGWIPITTRAFHFSNKFIDHLFDPIYPHFYVVATVDPNFKYSRGRLRELDGYDNISRRTT